MTVCPVSTVVAADTASDVTFTIVTASNLNEECSATLTGAQDPVDVIVMSTTGEITVTLLPGDGPSAAGAGPFLIDSGATKCFSVSSGEALRSDGSIHFRLEAEGTFSTLRPKVAVVQRKNVNTY